MIPVDSAIVQLREDRDDLKIRLSLMEDARAPDEDKIQSVRLALERIEANLAQRSRPVRR